MKKISAYIVAVVVFGALASAFVGCHSDRPKPFLNEEEMCDLLTDIRLTEARLYNNRVTDASTYIEQMSERSLDVYVPIFKKYGITYDQYLALMRYYMAHPSKMKTVYEKSAEHLKTELEEKRSADSAV